MKEDDRIDISRTVRRRIDTTNYVVFVSKTENHVSTLWEELGERKFMSKQIEAQRKLCSMTQGDIRFPQCLRL